MNRTIKTLLVLMLCSLLVCCGKRKEYPHSREIECISDDIIYCKYRTLVSEDKESEGKVKWWCAGGTSFEVETEEGERAEVNVEDVSEVSCTKHNRKVREYEIKKYDGEEVVIRIYFPQNKFKM